MLNFGRVEQSTKELSLGHPSRVSIDEPPIDPLKGEV